MRQDTLKRTLALIHQLSTGHRRVEDLANRHKVTPRTIYRDLDLLLEAGFTVASTTPEDGPVKWYIHAHGSRCPVCHRKA